MTNAIEINTTDHITPEKFLECDAANLQKALEWWEGQKSRFKNENVEDKTVRSVARYFENPVYLIACPEKAHVLFRLVCLGLGRLVTHNPVPASPSETTSDAERPEPIWES